MTTNSDVEKAETPAQAMTVIQRAQVALKAADHEPKLRELAAKHADIVEITNAAGYQQVRAARIVLKNTRVEIQANAKVAREDANAFAGAVIAEEKRLVGIISPEEQRLFALEGEWEDRIAAEKKAREQAEERRVEALRARVDAIRANGFDVSHLSPADLEMRIRDLVALEIGEDYAEMRAQANTAKLETLDRLRAILAKAQERERLEAERKAAQEAEAARLAAERAELERLRAEQARLDAEEAARLAAERQRFEAEQAEARAQLEREQAAARQAKVDADLAAAEERERLEVEQRRLDQERADLAEKERQRQEAEKREQLRKDAEEAERVRQQQAAEAERVRREQELEENRRAEQARKERQAEIDSATLRDAALEAHVLLQELAPAHITTAKLGAALSREFAPLPSSKPARARRVAGEQEQVA